MYTMYMYIRVPIGPPAELWGQGPCGPPGGPEFFCVGFD